MSRTTREAFFSALFLKLAAIPGLKVSSRTLKQIQDLPQESLPAAYQVQGKQPIVFKGTLPTNTWTATWILYADSQDPNIPASAVLNALVDAACATLAPPPGFDKQTIGGLVDYAAISGEIEYFEGLLNDKAIALIPIHAVVGGY